MLAWVAAFLALYYLAHFVKKRGWKSLLSASAFALLSTYLFIVFPFTYTPLVLLTSLALVAVLHFLPSIFQSICLAAYFILLLLALLFNSLTHMIEDKPIAKVVIQGKKVRVEDLKGKTLGTYVLDGDLVGIRARTIRFSAFLYFLGFTNVCSLDSIHNGYLKVEDHNRLFHVAYALSSQSFLWQKLFQQNWSLPGIKNALLQSQYLPLTDGAYYITITDGGISCLPTPGEDGP
ncbi:MAG: hypothetical protein JSR58_03255 [Verrucomicrobia bacterium]|nr:hypothetical protein [Verrucomicrobiota bacterium]